MNYGTSGDYEQPRCAHVPGNPPPAWAVVEGGGHRWHFPVIAWTAVYPFLSRVPDMTAIVLTPDGPRHAQGLNVIGYTMQPPEGSAW